MPNPATWSYWTEDPGAPVEFAFWEGDRAPLVDCHFHEHAQVTVVLSGSRMFDIGGERFRVEAGQFLYIPGLLPHQTCDHTHPGTRCLNIYGSLPEAPGRVVLSDLVTLTKSLAVMAPEEINCAVRHALMHYATAGSVIDAANAPPDLDEAARVEDLAARSGMTREAFTRRFAREFGIAPHAFRLVQRLNKARQDLQAGAAPASVAADHGFADQSHLGRHFRRVFGISPGIYRKRIARSQTFQTDRSPQE